MGLGIKPARLHPLGQRAAMPPGIAAKPITSLAGFPGCPKQACGKELGLSHLSMQCLLILAGGAQ